MAKLSKNLLLLLSAALLAVSIAHSDWRQQKLLLLLSGRYNDDELTASHWSRFAGHIDHAFEIVTVLDKRRTEVSWSSVSIPSPAFFSAFL